MKRDGRLEICFNHAWGTVCNNSFGIPDAMTACNQLVGFEGVGKLRSYNVKADLIYLLQHVMCLCLFVIVKEPQNHNNRFYYCAINL